MKLPNGGFIYTFVLLFMAKFDRLKQLDVDLSPPVLIGTLTVNELNFAAIKLCRLLEYPNPRNISRY